MSMEKWGVSLANRRPPASEFAPDYKKLGEIGVVEFDGVQLGKLECTTFLKKNRLEWVAFSRVLDAGLTRQAAELNGVLWYDFQAHFIRRCKLAADLNAGMVEADFDFIRAVNDREYAQKLRKLLRLLVAGMPENLHFVLPLRFPVVGYEFSGSQAAAAFSDLMLPELRLMIEIHIHEIQFSSEQIAFLNSLKYNTAAIRLIYEPELGNQPGAGIVQKLHELTENWPTEQVWYWSPVYAGSDTLEHEQTLYPALMRSLYKE